jgi:hypothetical protein
MDDLPFLIGDDGSSRLGATMLRGIEDSRLQTRKMFDMGSHSLLSMRSS